MSASKAAVGVLALNTLLEGAGSVFFFVNPAAAMTGLLPDAAGDPRSRMQFAFGGAVLSLVVGSATALFLAAVGLGGGNRALLPSLLAWTAYHLVVVADVVVYDGAPVPSAKAGEWLQTAKFLHLGLMAVSFMGALFALFNVVPPPADRPAGRPVASNLALGESRRKAQ